MFIGTQRPLKGPLVQTSLRSSHRGTLKATEVDLAALPLNQQDAQRLPLTPLESLATALGLVPLRSTRTPASTRVRVVLLVSTHPSNVPLVSTRATHVDPEITKALHLLLENLSKENLVTTTALVSALTLSATSVEKLDTTPPGAL